MVTVRYSCQNCAGLPDGLDHGVCVTVYTQSTGSKASLALVGRMVPSHESGFQTRSRALDLAKDPCNTKHAGSDWAHLY
jgi:hypothetical protein